MSCYAFCNYYSAECDKTFRDTPTYNYTPNNARIISYRHVLETFYIIELCGMAVRWCNNRKVNQIEKENYTQNFIYNLFLCSVFCITEKL